VAFSSLKYVPPDATLEGTLWIACIPTDGFGFGCELDEEKLDEAFAGIDEDSSYEDYLAALEAVQAAGFIGYEPDWDPMWTVPDNALDGLSEDEAQEGVNAFVNIIMDAGEESPDGEDEIAFKRMPVSEAVSPNHNPDIADFVVAGQPLDGAIGFNARRGQTYVIEPVLADGHVETYQYLNSDGETEWRSEEPFFLWYTETGPGRQGKLENEQASFDAPESLYPYTSVEWTAPKEPSEILIHTVVRDRRGGMGWRSLRVNVL
jgi:hypothetical protein